MALTTAEAAPSTEHIKVIAYYCLAAIASKQGQKQLETKYLQECIKLPLSDTRQLEYAKKEQDRAKEILARR